jgi:hypothetical protein
MGAHRHVDEDTAGFFSDAAVTALAARAASLSSYIEGEFRMEYKDILDHLAPCGLNCRKCIGHADGEIKECSRRLLQLLGSFDRYAERFSGFLPVFGGYPRFKDLLEHFSGASCLGCRKGACGYLDCGVFVCYRQKGVDFCFQCDAFPCGHTNFDPDLKRRWIEMNGRMREIGVEAYFEETRDLPRYR